MYFIFLIKAGVNGNNRETESPDQWVWTFLFSHRIDGNSKRNELNQAAFTIVAKAPTRLPDARAYLSLR